jgi:hypothetical protein
MSIKVKVGGSRSIRATPKQDTTRSIVAQGQSKPVITPDSVTLGVDTVGSYIRDLEAGRGITVSGNTGIESANVVIHHANTTTAVSTVNDPLDFITNIDIDQFGHITQFDNSTFWSYHFEVQSGPNGNIIRSKDFTIGNTSIAAGESSNVLLGLDTFEVGKLTFTQNRITSSQDISLSPRIGGVVDVNNHRISNIYDPENAQDAVNRRYLDNTIDDLTISFRVLDDPVDPTDPANKRYVDLVQEDIFEKIVVIAATTGDLGATYAENPFDAVANTNVSSTLTIPRSLILDIDGVTNWSLGDGLLVKNQTNPIENGRYELIQVGDGISDWIFQRPIYTDETKEIAGFPVFVTDGSTYGQTGWVATVADAETFELDSDGIIYSQFQGTGTFTAGRGLTLTGSLGTEFEVDYTQTFDNIIGKDDSLIITSNVVDVNSAGGLILPVGTTNDRPTAEQGMIRYNTTDNQFEGYKGTAWAGLGGVIDVDQDTKIIAESGAGTDNDQLDFFNSGNQTLRLDADGDFKFGDGLNKFTIDWATGDTNIGGTLSIGGGIGGSGLSAGNLTENRVIFVGSGGSLIDSNTLRFDGSTLTVDGDTDITGNLTLGGNITIGDANVDTIEVVADFTSNLVPNADLTYNLGAIGKQWNRIFTPEIKSDSEVVSIGTIGALKLPVGAVGDRPSAETGMIRYNTTDSRFEGYDGNIWAGLAGSVIDVDQDTKIVAESSPNADNDQLDFFTAGVQRARIDSSGDVRFGNGLNKVIINYNTGELNVNTKITSNADLFLEANGAVNASGTKITNVANPTSNTDVVTFDYLENGDFTRTLDILEGSNTYNMTLLENDPTFQIGLGLNAEFVNNALLIQLAPSGVSSGRYGNDGYTPRFTVDGFGRIIDATEVPFVLQSNAIVEFEEASQDITASQFRFGTHQGISYTYEDASANGVINSTIDDFVINVTGDMVGSNTVLSVSDVTIPLTANFNFVNDVQGEANGSIVVFHSQGVGSTATIMHGDTSVMGDTGFVNGTVIQNLTFDDYGHVQTAAAINLDARYLSLAGGVLTGNISAPRFIDSNNPNYYMDPHSESRVNRMHFGYGGSTTQLSFTDGSGTVSTMYAAGGRVGFLNNSFNYTAYAERATSNWVVPDGDVEAKRFVDIDNISYFLHPAGTDSLLNELEIDNSLTVGTTIDAGTSVQVNSNLTLTTNEIATVGESDLSLNPASNVVDVNSSLISNLLSPVAGTDAANKAYVDATAQGLRVIPSALAATTTDLGGTFDGDLRTITGPTNTPFALDGVTNWEIGDRVLVKDQTDPIQNGAYVLTQDGNAVDPARPWILTRGEYFNESDEIPGSFVFVTDGTVNNGTGWVAQVDDAELFTLNSDDINWYQFSGAGTYTAGYGLSITGTEFRVTNPFINFGSDAGVADEVRLGETLTLVGGEGIDTSHANNEITISAELASTTNIGAAAFSAANFNVSAGVVTVSQINGGAF